MIVKKGDEGIARTISIPAIIRNKPTAPGN